MNKKICITCSTQNEEHFTYCKYCGALLPVVDRQPDQLPPFDSGDGQADKLGISRKEYKDYVGANCDYILNNFEQIEKTERKMSFCPAVFFLGLFFGFYGISAWFMSRRMVKKGFIILLAGIFFTFIDATLNIGLNRQLYSLFESSFFISPDSLPQFLSYFYGRVAVSDYFSFVFSFVSAFFAMNAYKNKVATDILRIKSECLESSELPLNRLIKNAGGKRYGLGVLPFILLIVANIIAFGVTVI